jgi:DNA-binding LytR/AlgR family response regulator
MSTALPARVLVVETDPLYQSFLQSLLPRLGYAVLGPVATAAAALDLAHAHAPAVALLDLDQHHEPAGLTLAGLLQVPRPLPLVLLQGSAALPPSPDERAVQAAAWVRKTFDLPGLGEKLDLALQLARRPAARPDERPRLLADYVFVRSKGALLRLPLQEVLYLRADGNYTQVVLTKGTETLRCPLHELAQQLAPDGFLQCHRSHLLNLRHVTGLDAHQTTVRLGKVELPLSRSYRELLLACLRRLA